MDRGLRVYVVEFLVAQAEAGDCTITRADIEQEEDAELKQMLVEAYGRAMLLFGYEEQVLE